MLKISYVHFVLFQEVKKWRNILLPLDPFLINLKQKWSKMMRSKTFITLCRISLCKQRYGTKHSQRSLIHCHKIPHVLILTFKNKAFQRSKVKMKKSRTLILSFLNYSGKRLIEIWWRRRRRAHYMIMTNQKIYLSHWCFCLNKQTYSPKCSNTEKMGYSPLRSRQLNKNNFLGRIFESDIFWGDSMIMNDWALKLLWIFPLREDIWTLKVANEWYNGLEPNDIWV